MASNALGCQKAFEVCRVFNNHRKNSSTKQIIGDFFKSIFQNFDSHIDWMMDNSEIDIVLLVNREVFLVREGLSNNSIILVENYSLYMHKLELRTVSEFVLTIDTIVLDQ